jgi:hypothetical protein
MDRGNNPFTPLEVQEGVDSDSDNDSADTPTPVNTNKRKAEGKQKKPKASKVAAFGKNAVNDSSYKPEQENKKRTMKETTSLTKSLQGSHGTRTLNAGVLKANLRYLIN